jgi:cytochrome P450
MVLQQLASLEINQIPPPGPPALPLIGMLPFWGTHLHLKLNRLAEKYGNVLQIQTGGRKVVVLSGIETIKEALVKQQDSFNIRADLEIFKQPPQSHFLELKSGEIWKRHHAIVSQIIHTFAVCKSEIIESWVLEETSDLVNTFLEFGDHPFDPDLYLPLATLNFMQRLIFEKRSTFEEIENDSTFIACARNLKHIPKVIEGVKLEFIPKILQPVFKLSRLMIVRDFLKGLTGLENYVSKNVEQHRESFDPEHLRDITDGLLKASSELTDSDRNNIGLSEDDIVNGSLMQFAGAGGGLPSIILRWALLYLVAYPDIQSAVQKELDKVVGRDQKPCLEHRGKLPLTEACINEILRHSSLTTMPPITYATSADTTLEGYFIPKNTPVFINYYGLTRDERYWKDSEEFNPYRFLDEDGKLRNNLVDKFCPFGIGSRRCIGEYLGRLLIFLFFTNLLHQCKFERVSGEKLSLKHQLGVFTIPSAYRVIAKPRY